MTFTSWENILYLIIGLSFICFVILAVVFELNPPKDGKRGIVRKIGHWVKNVIDALTGLG